MKAMQRTALLLVLASVLAIPTTTLLASELPTQDEHAAHHPDAMQTPASVDAMPAMQDRMRQILQTTDPEKRKQLMEAQMKDMETLMRDPDHSCPMVEGKCGMDRAGGKCGKGDMGGKGGKCGMDTMGGKGMHGHGMQGGMGMSGRDDMMAKRMQILERRMDMMQMMMMMQMRMGMQGGMGPGMPGGMGMPGK